MRFLAMVYFRISRLLMHYNKFAQLMLAFLFFDRIGWIWLWGIIPLRVVRSGRLICESRWLCKKHALKFAKEQVEKL